MIMILDVDVTAERRHYNTYRPAGDTITLGPKGLCPRSGSDATLRHNLRRQPHPFFYLRRSRHRTF